MPPFSAPRSRPPARAGGLPAKLELREGKPRSRGREHPRARGPGWSAHSIQRMGWDGRDPHGQCAARRGRFRCGRLSLLPALGRAAGVTPPRGAPGPPILPGMMDGSSIHPSVHPSIRPSIRPSIHPSVRPGWGHFFCNQMVATTAQMVATTAQMVAQNGGPEWWQMANGKCRTGAGSREFHRPLPRAPPGPRRRQGGVPHRGHDDDHDMHDGLQAGVHHGPEPQPLPEALAQVSHRAAGPGTQ